MVGIAAMTLLIAVGNAFYLRFLIALIRECRRYRTCHLVQLQPAPFQYSIPKPKIRAKTQLRPAA